MYQLIDGEFYEIITTDIWVYANGTYGVTMPFTLQQTAPPTIGGVPLEDFKPIPCYDAKSDYGRTSVQCGPYHVEVVNGNTYVQSCYDRNDVTCRVRFKKDDHEFVIWNPETE